MMKTIRINGVDQDVQAGAMIFDEYLRDLHRNLSPNRQVVSKIRIDGREITETEEETIKAMPIDKLGQIELETSNPADLAFETLTTLDQYIDRLIASVERAAVHYKGKNLITGDAYFAKAIDGLDLFVQTIGGVKLALRVGLNTRVALAEATLISVMNDVLEAKRQTNYVFMAELLEKDLIENLRDWKESIFPLLRTLRDN